MLKVINFFKNKIPNQNLIFKNENNKAVNLIILPEIGSRGYDLINKYKKKGYWDYVIIPHSVMFLSRKILFNSYYKSFKTAAPGVKIQRKFLKTQSETRSVVIDLTPLGEQISAFLKTRSKKITIEETFALLEQMSHDSNASGKTTYFILNSDEEKNILEAIFYFARLQKNKIRLKNIEGIIVFSGRKFWPLTIQEEDKDGKYLKININIYTRIIKEVFGETPNEEQTPEEAIKETRKVVEKLYELHQTKLKSSTSNVSNVVKNSENVEENPLELIKQEVERNPYLKGSSFEEKLSNLFAQKEQKDQKSKKDPKKIEKTIKDISEGLKDLQFKYNGAVELNENQVKKTAGTFFNPLNIIGFKTFHAYNRQDTEFGENLDQAIFDLIKSLEADKELGIKIIGVRTEITDTNKDRFKTYKIKIQHKNFGYSKPYTVSFHVPIPSKGKYLKLGGNDIIMINQFFPKPVIKVSPMVVRLYTHYGTCSVFLKTHALREEKDFKDMAEKFSSNLKRIKKLKKEMTVLDSEVRTRIIEKYGLPDYIDSKVFINLETK